MVKSTHVTDLLKALRALTYKEAMQVAECLLIAQAPDNEEDFDFTKEEVAGVAKDIDDMIDLISYRLDGSGEIQ